MVHMSLGPQGHATASDAQGPLHQIHDFPDPLADLESRSRSGLLPLLRVWEGHFKLRTF